MGIVQVFAGLEYDYNKGRALAGLYSFDERGELQRISHEDWLKILNELDGEAGNLVVATLRKAEEIDFISLPQAALENKNYRK